MPEPVWSKYNEEPASWRNDVDRCQGGIFQGVRSMYLTNQGNTPRYFRYGVPGGEAIGVAFGISYQCRFALRQKHLYFGSLPAFAAGVDTGRALGEFQRFLKRSPYAHAEFNSFDAQYLPPDGINPRLEYVVALKPEIDLIAQLHPGLRRRVRNSARENLSVRFLSGAEARHAVLGAQASTAERAESRSRGFTPVSSSHWQESLCPDAKLPFAGMCVLAAFFGDTLLSAILLGWASRRVYYLIGGSTPEGFKHSSAAWLQVEAMRRMTAEGMTAYNLGGTPMGAEEEDSPSNGLYRFKTSFGPTVHECRGLNWELSRSHAALHGAVARLRRIRR